MIKILVGIFLFAGGIPSSAQGSAFPSPKSFVPEYVSQVRDMSKFYFYANGGFHADWYIGYNNSWIVKLPPVEAASYAKVFMGAKIGRAKTKSYPNSGDKNVIPGKIYMAISQTPSFTTDNMYFLTDSEDLPREPLQGDCIKGVNSAQWFWAEIPVSAVSKDNPNYIALWSSSVFFKSSSSSPVVAAALSDDKSENVWINRSIKGSPPFGENTLEIPINGVKPAMALKLVPKNAYRVIIKGFRAEIGYEEMIISFSAIGEDIHSVWLELSYDKFDWQKITSRTFDSPYYFTFKNGELSKDMFYLRAVGIDSLGNVGYSKEIVIPAISENSDAFDGFGDSEGSDDGDY